jgi:hypothetical protein
VDGFVVFAGVYPLQFIAFYHYFWREQRKETNHLAGAGHQEDGKAADAPDFHDSLVLD